MGQDLTLRRVQRCSSAVQCLDSRDNVRHEGALSVRTPCNGAAAAVSIAPPWCTQDTASRSPNLLTRNVRKAMPCRARLPNPNMREEHQNLTKVTRHDELGTFFCSRTDHLCMHELQCVILETNNRSQIVCNKSSTAA